MSATGIIVLVHGSRGSRGRVEVEMALDRIVEGLKPYVASEVRVIGAALQFNQPTLEEAVESLAGSGVERIIIVPYFLFSGRHLTEHVPQMLADLQHSHTGVQFLVADNLGLDDYFIGLLAKRIRQAAPDVALQAVSNRGLSIESESMKIVDNLIHLPDNLTEDEIVVVKRIVHASGDPEIVGSIKFGGSAVASGVGALSLGHPIYTDVRMVLAGIDGRLADILGCPLSCTLDTMATSPLPNQMNITRSAAAIYHLGEKLDGAVVAIGNAPTALFALLDLIEGGKARPSLVIGMPVGFVKADESKQELMKQGIPYITVAGTRGGSPMAAATVNALLRIASCRSQSAQPYRAERDPIC
jgi:precorrin-8X/cobalt-precorrin-8 methylmutase